MGAWVLINAGWYYVHQAISDPAIAPLIEQLMVKEAAPTLPPTAGLEPHIYAGCLRERFANAALEHRLDQIAMDGSQKIPQRWLATLKAQQSRGIACDGILTALAAWIRYLRDGKADDPLAEPLAALWRSAGKNGIVEALFGGSGFFAKDWIATDAERDLLSRLVRQGEPRRSPRFPSPG